MARLIERDVHFDRPGMVRVSARIETALSSYTYNLLYRSEGIALELAEPDIGDLLGLSELCAELQQELERPLYNQPERFLGVRCSPFDRRATIQERHYDDHPSRIALFLADALEDEDEPALNTHLDRTERFIYRCPKGCEYVEKNVAALPFYLAEHRKVVREHAVRLAAKRDLWRKISRGITAHPPSW